MRECRHRTRDEEQLRTQLLTREQEQELCAGRLSEAEMDRWLEMLNKSVLRQPYYECLEGKRVTTDEEHHLDCEADEENLAAPPAVHLAPPRLAEPSVWYVAYLHQLDVDDKASD